MISRTVKYHTQNNLHENIDKQVITEKKFSMD